MISKLLFFLFHLNYETRYTFEAIDSRFPLKDPDIDSKIERIIEIRNSHFCNFLFLFRTL